MSEQRIDNPDFEIGYSKARQLAKSHYENFPILSFLVPAKFRNDIAIIYWFARTADDCADEGIYESAIRLAKIQAFENNLNSLQNSHPTTDLESALRNTIQTRRLNPENFLIC